MTGACCCRASSPITPGITARSTSRFPSRSGVSARASLELALLIRPDELQTNLEKARRSLEMNYEDQDFASDVPDGVERFFLAREVDRLIRAIQSEMGFSEGKPSPESG